MRCLAAGAAVLHRPLIQAIERYGPLLPYQQPLLSTVASILSAPQAQQLALLRGGDADPEAAQAALALLGCCLRQAGRWRQAAAPQPAAVEALLRLGLPLAVANAACHHRDTSYQAVATLSALLALVLERDSPLHGMLLGFAGQQGPLLLQGLLLALLSLNSGSHLPKVGGWMCVYVKARVVRSGNREACLVPCFSACQPDNRHPPLPPARCRW